MRNRLFEICPFARRDSAYGKFIRTDCARPARLHARDFFDAPAGRGETEQRQANAGMRERGRPGGARQTECAGEHVTATTETARRHVGKGADDEKDRESCRDDRKNRPALRQRKDGAREQAAGNCNRETLRRTEKIAAPPRKLLAERHGERERQSKRNKGQIEVRRSDRDFLSCQRLERQRVKRTDENRSARAGQKQIVEDERALARERCQKAAGV